MTWSTLHIITKLELGGAQLATLCEVERSPFIDGERHLAFGPGGLLDDAAQKLRHVELHPLSSLERSVRFLGDFRAMLAIAALVRRLKKRRPDARLLVHTHSSKAGIIGRLGAFLGGADLIVHSIHGFGHSHHGRGILRRVFCAVERLAGLVTDGFTADSYANLEEGRRDRLLGKRPQCVVRCGVPLQDYAQNADTRAATRQALGIDDRALVVLTLACLKPQKDPLTWARVGAQVAATHKNVVFLLAGDGELRPALESFIATHQLAHPLRLLGWRRDTADLLAASDVFLLTSAWEGLPQAIIQAMAARLPVVATDVDGNREAVSVGETGELCQVGDVACLAAKITALLDDPRRRQRMGAIAATRCAPFSLEQMLVDLDRFYARLANSTLRNQRNFSCVW